MKRLLCFMLTATLTFLLSSCSNPKGYNKAVLSGINFTAEITKDSKTEIFLVKIDKNGDCELLFTKDGNPTDAGIFFSKNGATCFLNGTELETNIGLLADGLYADFIYSVFDSARDCEVKSSNGLPVIKADNGKYDFVLSLSGAGLPLTLNEKRFNVTCTFKNVTLN